MDLRPSFVVRKTWQRTDCSAQTLQIFIKIRSQLLLHRYILQRLIIILLHNKIINISLTRYNFDFSLQQNSNTTISESIVSSDYDSITWSNVSNWYAVAPIAYLEHEKCLTVVFYCETEVTCFISFLVLLCSV